MPIRINLLAEAQLAEEMRRRDPVKRAIMAAVVLIVLMLGWVGWQHTQVSDKAKALSALQAKGKQLKPEYDQVVAAIAKTKEVEGKLVYLKKYAAARFLWGTTLNSLQQCMTNVPTAVQVVRLQSVQDCFVQPPTKVGTTIKPGSATERIVIKIDAKDFGKDEDQNYNKFLDAIATFPYFKEIMAKGKGVSLENVSMRQGDPADPSVSYVLFTLECRLPDHVR